MKQLSMEISLIFYIFMEIHVNFMAILPNSDTSFAINSNWSGQHYSLRQLICRHVPRSFLLPTLGLFLRHGVDLIVYSNEILQFASGNNASEQG